VRRAAILTAILVLGAGIAWAAIECFPVSGYIVAATGTAERQWLDEDNVLHTRGWSGVETMVGDLAGTLYVTGRSDLDLDTGDGHQGGRLRFEGTWNGTECVFEGTWGGRITGFYFDGKWCARGEGDFRKHLLKVRNHGWLTPPDSEFIPQVYDGKIVRVGSRP
jgi:hypothetical protein